MPVRATPDHDLELSIGTLSAATGVPVDTLRTWERRYGFPVPIARTEGSHRRYAAETVERVHLIVRALALGHRPSAVIGRTADEIERLLSLGPRPSSDADTDRERRAVQRWLELTLELDGVGLATELERCLANMAVVPFLERCLGPYLVEVGERWARGELRVSHEHFAAERTREFLSGHWRAVAEGASPQAPRVVLATPPGERHVLGLHMAAWVVALATARPIFLGADTPTAEIAFAAVQHDASGVLLSVADGYAGDLAAHVTALSEALPEGVGLVIGGSGTRSGGSLDEKKMNSLLDLTRWCEDLSKFDILHNI